jgi:hypothetical protein
MVAVLIWILFIVLVASDILCVIFLGFAIKDFKETRERVVFGFGVGMFISILILTTLAILMFSLLN